MKKFLSLVLVCLMALCAVGCSGSYDSETEHLGERQEAVICHGAYPFGGLGTFSGTVDGYISGILSGAPYGAYGYDASDWLLYWSDLNGNVVGFDTIDFGTTANAEFYGGWYDPTGKITSLSLKGGVAAGSHPNPDSCDYGTDRDCIIINGQTAMTYKKAKVQFVSTLALPVSLSGGMTAIGGYNTAGGSSGADRLRFFRDVSGTVTGTGSGWVMSHGTCP